MSWSTSFESEGDHSKIIAEAELSQTYGDLKPEVRHQFEVAKQVATLLINSETVGDPDTHKFAITLHGHANENHEARDGWSNDAITVTVVQR